MVKMVKNGKKTGKKGKFWSEKGLCGLEMHFCEKKNLPKMGKNGGGSKMGKNDKF